MKDYFAEWYEIANLQPSPETLERRWQGVEKAAGALDSDDINQIGRCYHSITNDVGGPTVLIDALREADSTFVPLNHLQELAVLSGAVLHEALGDKNTDIANLAALVTVVPTVQGLRTSSVVPRLVDIAEQYLADRSRALRSAPLPQLKGSVVNKELVEAVSKAFNENAAPSATEPFGKIIATQNTIMKAQAASIGILADAYELLREESDMLWWLTGMHSRIATIPFSELKLGPSILLIGRELADLTRVIPGPLAMGAFAKRMLAQCFGSESSKDIQLATSINGLSRDIRDSWAKDAAKNDELPMCPIFNAVINSVSVAKDSEWLPLFKKSQHLEAKLKIAPDLLCRQVYLETLLLRTGGDTDGRE
ncbi:MAG TPA: GTPase-associated system all-helical protein GASH [Pirellulales bacterium]|nr:GTPase-associated system all-helical protein GASH [Pirellulales bacterium]